MQLGLPGHVANELWLIISSDSFDPARPGIEPGVINHRW